MFVLICYYYLLYFLVCCVQRLIQDFPVQSQLPAQATIPFVKISQIDHCHLPHLRLQACRHDTDRWYSPISVSSLPDGWWASVSWHPSVSCSQMLPQQCSDPGIGPADSSLAALLWGLRGLGLMMPPNEVPSPGSGWKFGQYGTAFSYSCATLFP